MADDTIKVSTEQISEEFQKAYDMGVEDSKKILIPLLESLKNPPINKGWNEAIDEAIKVVNGLHPHD